MQKYSYNHFHRPPLLPKTEQVRGNRNPPLLMVKPIKRYEDEDRVQNSGNDIKVWLLLYIHTHICIYIYYIYIYTHTHTPGLSLAFSFKVDVFEVR
jgi:hypothetical protein